MEETILYSQDTHVDHQLHVNTFGFFSNKGGKLFLKRSDQEVGCWLKTGHEKYVSFFGITPIPLLQLAIPPWLSRQLHELLYAEHLSPGGQPFRDNLISTQVAWALDNIRIIQSLYNLVTPDRSYIILTRPSTSRGCLHKDATKTCSQHYRYRAIRDFRYYLVQPPPFTDEETEAQGYDITFPASHSQQVSEVGFEPRFSGYEISTLLLSRRRQLPGS